MEPTRDELERTYASLEDEALTTAAADRFDFTELARAVLEQEMLIRGLALPGAHAASAQPEFSYVHWVTLDRFRDMSSAIVARSALEAAEIPCFLRDENTVRLDWQVSNFIGGMRLQVQETDVEAASAVLGGWAPKEMTENEEPLDPAEHCPYCGSTHIHRKPHYGFFSAIAVLWLSIPVPQGRHRWTCDACGKQWIDHVNE